MIYSVPVFCLSSIAKGTTKKIEYIQNIEKYIAVKNKPRENICRKMVCNAKWCTECICLNKI